MRKPATLCRYRPLDGGCHARVFEREIEALRDSYLYAPSFSQMNDPMEAFYETGGPGDAVVDAMLAPAGKSTADMYRILSEEINRWALVSFAETHQDLPMWAYYASNFGGMCLEFDVEQLKIGDLQNEELRPVTYARHPLPSLTIADLARDKLKSAAIDRFTRKRSEWAHEKEWRFITGEVGPKHYLDDALRRVFLGPLILPEHAARICEVLDRRSVEVLQGEIKGFELSFRTIKPARTNAEVERVGDGYFDPAEHLYAAEDLKQFLTVPFENLLAECRRTALRPNMQEFAGVDLSRSNKVSIYLWTTYKLRNGRTVCNKRYFDHRFRSLPGR